MRAGTVTGGRLAGAPMRYLTRLNVVFGALLLKAALMVAIVFFALARAEHHIERSRLAYAVYEQYLELSGKAWRMFKKLEDELLIDQPPQRSAEIDALAGEVAQHIAAIRGLIGAEIGYVGAEEIEELELLARIERAIGKAKEGFRQLDRWREVRDPRFQTELPAILEGGAYLEFRRALAEALDGEAEEVRETEAATARQIATLRLLAALAFAGGLVVAALGLYALRRDLRAPIKRLQAAAAAIGSGDLDHRVAVDGPIELGEVASAFNTMADRIAARERELEAARDSLDATVQARTAELERALGRLAEADRLRRRLLSDVSHELRTPLTIIRGETEFALRGKDKPADDYRDALARARDAAIHCARIVEDLLFVSRAEEGVARLDIGEVDLVALLDEKAAVARGLIPDAKGKVRFETSLSTATVRGDARRIRQVVLILVENALRYGDGDVLLRLDPAPGGYAVSVIDHGPGMTEAELEGAFQRFYRGAGAPSRYEAGSGLGLPVAKAIVEAHGGRIALRSAPGQGVTATFTLPARPRLEAVS